MGYIYKISNKISGKIYIGKTIQQNPAVRWKEHKYMCRQEKGGCPALRDAVRAHGIDAFLFEILIICFDEDCDRWEKEYIKKYNCIVPNGYNIFEGGQGGAGFRGKSHSVATKERLRETSTEYYKNVDNIERMRANAKRQMANMDRKEFGKKVIESEKYKKAIAEGRVGSGGHKDGKLSEETKTKIKAGVLKYFKENGGGHTCNIENHRDAMAKAKGKKVDQFTNDGNFITTYVSIAEASRETKVSKANIQLGLRGKYKNSEGFVWKYHIEPAPKIENEIIYDS
jgi:group I intron endonuclease